MNHECDDTAPASPAALGDEAEHPRGIFDAGFAAPTPPSTLAKAAAEEIAANYEVHKDRCHSNERYPLPPCDCGAIEEIAAIIERCFSAESVDKDDNEGLQQ